jgi:surface antigen
MNRTTYILIAMLTVLVLAGCQSRERTGALIGGATGTAVGQAVGGGTATLLGAIGGAAAGYFIGGRLDEKDKQEIAGVLEDQPLGETAIWTNPDTGTRYEVTPTATFQRDGQRCRRFQLSAVDENAEVERVACRTAEGNWQIAS